MPRRSLIVPTLLALTITTTHASAPYLVKDIHASITIGSSNPAALAALPGLTLFSACDAFHGCELWRTDGTSAGTNLVRDISAGSAGSNPQSLTLIGSVVYFSADDGTTGAELWRSDGTAAGTYRVKD